MVAEALDLLAAYDPDSVVLHDEKSGAVPAGQLSAGLERWRRLLDRPTKALVRIDRPRSREHLVAYLAALRAGHSVLLVDGTEPGRADEFDRAFAPDLVVSGDEIAPGPNAAEHPPPIHPELALLLMTSGSSGEPKVVRLSYDNLRSNAEAIATATAIAPTDRVATSLPLDFALGLSLVNSHLVAGATVALTGDSPVTRRFWQAVDAAAATTVGLVPSACRSILAWRWEPSLHPSLARLLVSGGPLEVPTILRLAEMMWAEGRELVCMYGQAEATARISCLPPDLVLTHPGSVGVAVPDTEVRIVPMKDGPPGLGEIEVTGPGVMMGYGRHRGDLALGDVQGPRLRTGDLGYVQDGLLYVHGRVDRQVKVLGRRVDLAGVEAALTAAGLGLVAAVTWGEDRVLLAVEGALRSEDVLAWRQRAADHSGLPLSCVQVRVVPALPRTPSGKVSYGELPSVLAR